MSRFRPALRLYACLLRLYPPGFQDEFGAEMRAVFAAALENAAGQGMRAAARLLLRELAGLAAGLFIEYRDEFQKRVLGKEGSMSASKPLVETAPEPPDSWGGALAAAGLFLLIGLSLIERQMPGVLLETPPPTWYIPLTAALFVGAPLIAVVGVVFGSIRGFPRWSYAFAGYAFVGSLYMMMVKIPFFQPFGSGPGRPVLVFGFLAWIPLGLALLAGLAVTRSFRPLGRFFIQIGQDWTRASFFIFSFLPMLIFISFDEMDHLYTLVFMALVTMLMVVTALLYLRSAGRRSRAMWLSLGTLAVILVASVGPTAYWLPRNGVSIIGTAVWTAIILAVAFSPMLIGLRKRRGGTG